MQEYEYIIRLREAMKDKYSEEYIKKCTEYARSLLEKNLPVIFDRPHIIQILKLNYIKMDCYHSFFIHGKSKERQISAPSNELKKRQRWILREILEKIEVNDCCHGFVAERSIVTNARMHMGQKNILNIDIKDFFPSITYDMVRKVFEEIGYSRQAAGGLADLSCHNGVLPQGAPTSPYLANLVMRGMDKELADLCGRNHIVYTRYADDMSFSSDGDVMKCWDELKKIIEKYSFCVNEEKTVYYQEPYRKIVTGLLVREDSVCVPKAYKRKLKQEIYYCKKFGVAQHLENTGNKERAAFKEYLYGKAYYVNMVEPETGQRFLRELDTIGWEY